MKTPTAQAHALHGKAGGISWQARLLNTFFRHAVKRSISTTGLSPGAARSVVRLLELVPARLADLATVHPVRIAGIACDVVVPLNPPPTERVVLYLHGGGFFAHMPRSYKRFARRLAEAMGATVYVPAYRLAPEHRYPAATDDCLAVYQGLLVDGCDPGSMCIMGDSAGGNLALVTLLRARDEGLPLPCSAIVISPGADLTFSGTSLQSNADADPFIPAHSLLRVVKQYVDADKVAHPYVSPVRGDFTGLPPLKILVGSTEVLLDSSIDTARTSRRDGVNVILQIWREMPHVFPMFGFLPEGKMAMQYMAEFFNKHIVAPVPLPE